MKTLEQILAQQPVFLEDWADTKWEGMASDCREKEILELHVLFAYYLQECYSGEAYALVEKGGKLYEFFGSHCSCYGLEGQFFLEEVTLEALEFKFHANRKYMSAQERQLCEFLGIYFDTWGK